MTLPQPGEGEPTLAERFRAAASKLARLYALCSSHKDMGAHRDDVAYFDEIRAWMAKFDAEDRRARGLPIPAEVELYVRQLTTGASPSSATRSRLLLSQPANEPSTNDQKARTPSWRSGL